MKYLFLALTLAMSVHAAHAADFPVVVVQTNLGSFEVELNADKAPISVKNFLQYVDAQFYDQTIFHRVIKSFVIQGGGFNKDMVEKSYNAPIVNEAGNGLSNVKGTIGMARDENINSATAQFYINTKDNLRLDHQDESPAHFGYAVFGKVTQGYEVIEAIESSATHTVGENDDVPINAIVVSTIKRK